MLFAGDRDIIGFLQSYPPQPIYGDTGLTALASPNPGPRPVKPGEVPTDPSSPYAPPGRIMVDGGTDIDHLLRSLGLPNNEAIAMGNPSFDIGGGHKGANKAAKIYNKIRANDNMNEVETIKRILGGPSLPTF